MTDHRELREALGAYALGLLRGPERTEVEAHLPGCTVCREELAGLAVLPGLLGRLRADDLVGVAQAPAAAARAQAHAAVVPVLARVAAQRGRERRTLRRWQSACAGAVAVIAGVLIWSSATAPARPPTPTAPVVVVAGAATGVTGTAAAHAWEWGTTVELDLRGLPAIERFEVVAVATDGRREVVGSWAGTRTGEVGWRGGTALAAADLTRIEVTDASGTTLLAADPPGR